VGVDERLGKEAEYRKRSEGEGGRAGAARGRPHRAPIQDQPDTKGGRDHQRKDEKTPRRPEPVVLHAHQEGQPDQDHHGARVRHHLGGRDRASNRRSGGGGGGASPGLERRNGGDLLGADQGRTGPPLEVVRQAHFSRTVPAFECFSG